MNTYKVSPPTVAAFPIAAAALFMGGPCYSKSYVCRTVSPDGTCAQYVEVIQSLASLNGVGITTEIMAIVVTFSLGAVMLFFILGLGLGLGHRVLKTALGGAN